MGKKIKIGRYTDTVYTLTGGLMEGGWLHKIEFYALRINKFFLCIRNYSVLTSERKVSQTAYYHDRTVTTYPHTRKSYYGIPESMENVEPFDKCGNEFYEDENGVYHSYYGLDTDNESDYNELVYAICESKNCPKSEVVRLVKE